jgi:hypothetical protein
MRKLVIAGLALPALFAASGKAEADVNYPWCLMETPGAMSASLRAVSYVCRMEGTGGLVASAYRTPLTSRGSRPCRKPLAPRWQLAFQGTRLVPEVSARRVVYTLQPNAVSLDAM